jgi:hypothetical protein
MVAVIEKEAIIRCRLLRQQPTLPIPARTSATNLPPQSE